MATLTTNISAKQADPKPKNMVDGKDLTPNFTIIPVTYTTASTDANADTINLIKLPKGTKILSGSSYVYSGASTAGTSYTVTVGANADVDALSTAIDIDGAGKVAFALTGVVELTSESYVTATAAISGAVPDDVDVVFYLAVALP